MNSHLPASLSVSKIVLKHWVIIIYLPPIFVEVKVFVGTNIPVPIVMLTWHHSVYFCSFIFTY